MKKSLLAVGFVAVLSATSFAMPAHADELPVPTPSDAPPPPTPPSTDTPAPLAATPYKVEFNWTTPENPGGEPYATCDVKFLRTNGSIALEAPYPASVTKLAFSFSETEMSGSPVVPGVDSLSLEYTCATAAGETSQVYHIDSMVIPDVVPTTPTYVDVNQGAQGALSVNYGGSTTVGAAGLNGYQLDVLKDGLPYASVSTDTAAGGSYELGAAAAHGMLRAGALIKKTSVAKAAGARYVAAAQGLSNLPTGLYTVQVRGRNAVGLSNALSSKTIAVQGKTLTPIKVVAPSKVRALKVNPAKTSVNLSWQTPLRGDIKQYRVTVISVTKNTFKTVKAVTLAGSKRGVKLTGLKAHKTYQLRVAALNAYGTSAVIADHFTTKRR